MFTVCLDPGHGGKDSGAIGNNLKEKDIVLDIALKAFELLKANDIDAILTRDKDITVEMSKRILPCDVSVSIHVNAGGGRGIEVWRALYNQADKSSILANILHKNLIPIFSVTRGIKTRKSTHGNYDYYYMLRKPLGIPVLIELGFIDNATDANILKTRKNEIAEAIAKSICEYIGVPYYRLYIVQKGDSLWKIAQKVYGSGKEYAKLVKLNGLKTVIIKQGMKLKY